MLYLGRRWFCIYLKKLTWSFDQIQGIVVVNVTVNVEHVGKQMFDKMFVKILTKMLKICEILKIEVARRMWKL